MRGLLRWLAVLAALAAAASARADEEVQDYLNALKEAGFTDLAVEVVEDILQKQKIGPEERADYELDVASLMADASRNVADLVQSEQFLLAAQKRFDEFARKHPGHPRRAEALAQTASVELQTGRLRIVQAQLPGFAAQAAKLADEGRAALTRASTSFEKAYVLLSEQRDKIPLPLDDDRAAPRIRKERGRLFKEVMNSRFQAAYAIFLLGDSYQSVVVPEPAAGDAAGLEAAQRRKEKWQAEYLKQVGAAESKFESIFVDYRQWLVAPIARSWQARCLAARGDYRRAKGMFEELLADKDPRLGFLHRRVFLFEMMAAASQKDWQTLIVRSEEWLRTNGRFRKTSDFLGIQLELARARIALGKDAADSKTRDEHFRKANESLEQIGRTPNELQGLARREQLRLEDALAKTSQAHSFQQFFSRAKARLDDLAPSMTSEERRQGLYKAKSLLMEALGAATPSDPAYQARLQLAYACFELGEFYDAALLGEYEATEYPKGPAVGEAAGIALAAYGRAYEVAAQSKNSPEVEAAELTAFASYCIDRWPSGPAGDDARLTLGMLEAHSSRKNFQEAVKLLDAVPQTSSRYSEGASQAGQTYLEWYNSRRGDSAARDELRDLRAKARDRLTSASRALLVSRSGKIDRLTFANDVALAQMLLEDNEPQKALDLINPLVAGVEQGTLPANIDSGMRLAAIQTCLMTVVQAGKLDVADRLMELLAKQKGQEKAGGLTQSFLILAAKMRDRIDQLQASGEDELGRKVEEAYEAFLSRLAEREAGQTLQSLAFLGLAYVELRRYDRAEGFLAKALAAAKDAPPEDLPHVIRAKVAHARCLAGLKKFDEAVAAVDAVIAEQGQSIEAVMAKGKILMAAGQTKAARAHWARLLNQTNKRRPAEFYEALFQLVETERQAPPEERKAALTKARGFLKRVLGTEDSRLSADWRTKLELQLKQLENER